MKVVKLSLVAALAAGAFCAAQAKPFEEAIKGVDLSGFARYRYDSGSWSNGSLGLNAGVNSVNTLQDHRYRAFVNAKVFIGDGFSFFGQLMYNNDSNHGFAHGTTAQGAQTKSAPVLKQAYLSYNNPIGLGISLGRQELGTIWTEDLTGMVAKVTLKPVEEVTIAVYGVDNIEGAGSPWQVGDTDATNFQVYNAAYNTLVSGVATDTKLTSLTERLYKENIYGAAALTNFAGFKANLWAAYWDKTATLYALDLGYKVPFGDGKDGLGIKVTYLGNALNSELQDDVNLALSNAGDDKLANGNLVDARVTVDVAGFDARVGGIFFGSKDKFSINTLEGFGGAGLGAIGKEILYSKGSWVPLSVGQSTFGYLAAGYTLPADIRLGVQGVFGATTNGDEFDGAAFGEGTKMELVAETSWKATKNLNLSLWYSHLSTKLDETKTAANATNYANSIKHSVRFEALYKF